MYYSPRLQTGLNVNVRRYPGALLLQNSLVFTVVVIVVVLYISHDQRRQTNV